jgi:DNA ligase-1
MSFRPLLAAQLDDAGQVRYPVLVSAKIDGIRCVIHEGKALTRSLKAIPNHHIYQTLHNLPAFDGELTVGEPNDPTTWNATSSAVMSHEGEPAFTYWVFDMADSPSVFQERLRRASALTGLYEKRGVKLLPHVLVRNASELLEQESVAVDAGFEGLMLRDPGGAYKHGRSTLREQILLKMKRFDHSEAVIVGYKERQEHIGEAKINALGKMERDSKKENLARAGDLGAFICQWHNPRNELIGAPEFDVGSGYTADQRVRYWTKRDRLLGALIRIKHHGTTVEQKPRFPIFEGFRDGRDMDHG